MPMCLQESSRLSIILVGLKWTLLYPALVRRGMQWGIAARATRNMPKQLQIFFPWNRPGGCR